MIDHYQESMDFEWCRAQTLCKQWRRWTDELPIYPYLQPYTMVNTKRRGWIKCIMHECACVYQGETAIIYAPDEMPRGRIKCVHVDYHNQMHSRIWILSVICLSALWDQLKLPLSVCVRACVRCLSVCVWGGGCTCSLIYRRVTPPLKKKE